MKFKLLKLLSVFLFAIASCTNIQKPQPDPIIDLPPNPIPAAKEEEIITFVEIKAQFPKGEAEWQKYIKSKLTNFNAAKNGAPPGEYIVILDLTIDNKGIITGAKALSKNGYGIEDKVVSIVKKAPKWIPASLNGRKYI